MNQDIPSTPKPKRIDEIQYDACDRFCDVVFVTKQDIDLTSYLSEYDYWEQYDESKSYSKRPFQETYKGMIREYRNRLIVVSDYHDKEYYVVTKKSRSELKELESYCTCLKCQASYLNPFRYIWCNYCKNCIKAGKGFADKNYIEVAQQLKKHGKRYSLNKYNLYPQETLILKACEFVFLLFLFLYYLYF